MLIFFPALNHLTSQTEVAAAREVVYGLSFQLDWGYHKIGSPAFGRTGLKHKIIDYESITGEIAHDDEVTLNTQCGSQWDGFLHYADRKTAKYYNGISHHDSNQTQSEANGIHRESHSLFSLQKSLLIDTYA